MLHHPTAQTEFARSKSLRTAFILTLCLVLARLAVTAVVPLIPQEAYYWMYAQHPQLSYFDHPPMVAWVIHAGTWLFGNSEFGVRIVGQILMLGASAALYGWSRLWYGRRVSLIAAISLQLVPIFFALGFLATMDSSLIFFWTTALLGFGMAVRRGRRLGWYLAGAAIGAAMLSKYTAAFVPLGALMCLAVHRPWRRHLGTIHPYAAMVIAGAMFSPVIIWNAGHDWASFRFQFAGRYDRSNNPHPGLHYFLGEQLLVVTPVIFFALPMMLARTFRRGWRRRVVRCPRTRVALAFSMPMLAVMTWSSLRHDVHINWTAPLYVSLIPFIVHGVVARSRWRVRQARNGGRRRGFSLSALARSTTLEFGGVVSAGALLVLVSLPTLARYDISSPFGPWHALAIEVERAEDRLERESGREPLVIGCGKFELASELAFYSPAAADGDRACASTTSQWLMNGEDGIGYRYWLRRDDWIGRDCIVVGESRFLRHVTEPWFESVEVRELPRIHLSKPMALAVCRGLRREAKACGHGGWARRSNPVAATQSSEASIDKN
jgi:dolichol-phosphate mannosyltransferase